jgi:hypothetical protein
MSALVTAMDHRAMPLATLAEDGEAGRAFCAMIQWLKRKSFADLM